MNDGHIRIVASELHVGEKQVRAAAELLEDACTIPFIARYRKEATGSLDEVVIGKIADRLRQLADLDKRREAILKTLDERELLTDDLTKSIREAPTLTALEDIYLPFRPKRRTRAAMAKEKGLEPLAGKVFSQSDFHVVSEAEAYVNADAGVASVDEALAGARDIIAEWVAEDADTRAGMRDLFLKRAQIRSHAVKGKEDPKFRDYFDWEEDLSSAQSHRILAMFRGEREGVLSLKVRPDEAFAMDFLRRRFVKRDNSASRQVALALEDGYKRLLAPSIENDVRNDAKKRSDEEAIRVFADNLRELLLAPPLGHKRVMALDPGFRTGAKLVCLDEHGKLLHHETIYPTQSNASAENAGRTVRSLCTKFGIEAVAVGSGTAGRETERFVRSLGLPDSVVIVMVNESGASVYSASQAARDEFPDHDVTVRGAVSIGRRLMDPLSELVKIDPKSIGVGQYQHDVDQGDLKRSLDEVVASCVNRVGVELNTAGKELLTYVSGLGPTLAKNIVEWRNENGAFRSRSDLLKVRRLGNKAFQQAAGFLRIRDADNPLDASAVHPESYHIVEAMAKDAGCSVRDLISDEEHRKTIRLKDHETADVGLPTLRDIMNELAKPGRDPRDRFETFSFAEGVNSIDDLKSGMKIPGIVTNVTKFGAFVDIGVHQDGLVHISKLADRFVKDPSEIVRVRQKVMVTVLDVDKERGRISLSMTGR
ncbi:MAG: Tex family protein [Desulfomonilaceae bacterium]|nr:Tex family protein [Desulfomonilaceae bacterium]